MGLYPFQIFRAVLVGELAQVLVGVEIGAVQEVIFVCVVESLNKEMVVGQCVIKT